MSDVATAFHDAYGKAVATLVRVFGDISLAEDAVQDAFLRAVETWPRDGIPANPAGWIVTTARHRAVDIVRRDARGRELTVQIAADSPRGGEERDEDEDPALMRDDQLRLMFTCCHPAIRVENQVALTLRLIAGLTPAEVARAFLVSEDTMAKRLVRAKYKIKAAHIPYRLPEEAELPSRLRAVLSVLYLIYNAGADDPQDREALRRESIRLARELVTLMPDEPEATGLLALLLLSESRSVARRAGGEIVLLQDQDRSSWDQSLIGEGQRLVLAGLHHPHPGPFLLQAAIQGVHCAAGSYGDTDWPAILRFYDRLMVRAPNPVVALNRAIALGETAGPQEALAALESVIEQLDGYHLLHAARACMLERVGRTGEAETAYSRAIELAPTETERTLLARRRTDLAQARRPHQPASGHSRNRRAEAGDL